MTEDVIKIRNGNKLRIWLLNIGTILALIIGAVVAWESLKNRVSDMEDSHGMLVEKMGDSGQYAIFVGGLTVPLHNLWADEGLKYAAEKYPNLELVTERIPCGEDQELSRQTTLELLQSYPDLKGIIGFGSLGPPGAAQALIEKGLTEEVAVVGTVLPGHAAPYLKDGSLDHGILWDPKDAGYSLVWTAIQLLEGKDISDGMDVPGVGLITLDGNVIKVDAMLDITADNAEDLGF